MHTVQFYENDSFLIKGLAKFIGTALDDLSKPFQLDAQVVYISASIGITLYPQDADNASDLLRNADQALYQSKDAGRNRFSYFTRSMQELAQTRMSLSNDLRRAVDTRQLHCTTSPSSTWPPAPSARPRRCRAGATRRRG